MIAHVKGDLRPSSGSCSASGISASWAGAGHDGLRDLLENTDETVERIASLCGFGSAHQMRTHFTRINHVTPHAYQRTFRSRVGA